VQTHSRSQARPDFNLFCFLFILALLNKRFNSLMGGFDQPLKAGSPRDFIIVRKNAPISLPSMAVRSAGSDTVARTLSSGHAVLVLCSFFFSHFLFVLSPTRWLRTWAPRDHPMPSCWSWMWAPCLPHLLCGSLPCLTVWSSTGWSKSSLSHPSLTTTLQTPFEADCRDPNLPPVYTSVTRHLCAFEEFSSACAMITAGSSGP